MSVRWRAGVEHQGHHDAIILGSARARGDEQRLARIAARAEIVPRHGAGLEIDARELLLQAHRRSDGLQAM